MKTLDVAEIRMILLNLDLAVGNIQDNFPLVAINRIDDVRRAILRAAIQPVQVETVDAAIDVQPFTDRG